MDDLTAISTMAEALVDRGLASKDDVAAELQALDPKQPEAPGLPDTNEFDAVLFAGPPSPASYKFTPSEGGLEQEAQVRTALFERGIPAGIANEVDRQLVRAMQNPPNEAQLGSLRAESMRQLNKMHGPDVDRVLSIARQEFSAISAKVPGLADAITRSGLGNSAWLINSLYHVASAKRRA